jgi:hypothetical protein
MPMTFARPERSSIVDRRNEIISLPAKNTEAIKETKRQLKIMINVSLFLIDKFLNLGKTISDTISSEDHRLS